MKTVPTPEAASPLPLQGAPPAAWRSQFRGGRLVPMGALASSMFLTACASGPVPPAWQADAKTAMDRSAAAYLEGQTKASDAEMERARRALTSTGRADLLARAELMRCAARVASLVFEPCERFEVLRADAPASERAYADHLAARSLARDDIARLPPAQQAAATAVAGGDAALAGVQSAEDPLSRLIALAVLFQAGKASPPMIDSAVETASVQGWRRPLLAWLKVQALRAEKAGDATEAQRLQRRIALVEAAK